MELTAILYKRRDVKKQQPWIGVQDVNLNPLDFVKASK